MQNNRRGRPRIHPAGYSRKDYFREYWRRNADEINSRKRERYYMDIEFQAAEKRRKLAYYHAKKRIA